MKSCQVWLLSCFETISVTFADGGHKGTLKEMILEHSEE